MNDKKINIIVSIYNEEKNIPILFSEIKEQMKGYIYEVLFVNDGSKDNSLDELLTLKQTNKEVNIIDFSRNFGHEAAMIAGIDESNADINICMDADMQHPPNVLPQIIEKAIEGYNIVTLKREDRKDHNFFNKLLSRFFYFLFNIISPIKLEPNASDFFMVDKKVANILKRDYRERNRFLRGFVQILGFKKTSISYVAPKRIHGESNYSIRGLFKLSIQAIIAFSKRPLYLGVYLGVVFSVLSIFVAVYSIIMKIIGETPPGYTTLVVVVSSLFAIQFFLIGIIGLYLGFMFEEQKKRPLYIIDRIYKYE